MSEIRLKGLLVDAGISQAALARATGSSKAAINLVCNRGIWPRTNASALRAGICQFLTERGLATSDAFSSTQKKAPKRANARGPVSQQQPDEKDLVMLLRKQSLTHATRQHFGLARDPFVECREQADVFLTSPDVRYVRESMWSTVRHGGFLAVVGESGSGKTTLREELMERLARDEPAVVVAQPYVLAMEERDSVGKTLRSHHIAECILHAVAPMARLKSSPQARFRQLHEALRDSARSGMRHILMIEEAHCLPIPTLKHLKRYLELKDGMRPLLAIVLIGQPELAMKLDERNPQVREVAQRAEIVTLPPLDQHLDDYLRHRFVRVGASLADVIDEGGLEALRARLTPTGRQQRGGSLLYPLAVHNALAAAMNAAASLGAPKVTRDIVAGGVA